MTRGISKGGKHRKVESFQIRRRLSLSNEIAGYQIFVSVELRPGIAHFEPYFIRLEESVIHLLYRTFEQAYEVATEQFSGARISEY